MQISRAYHNVRLDIFPSQGSAKVCYVLIPEGAADNLTKWADKKSSESGCSFVLISGMDWNHDMSPWQAEGVMKKEKKFTGGAPMFLQSLTGDYIPYAEQIIKVKSPERYLMGVSLSGLFAIWSMARTDIFCGLASISGSLWFDKFPEWIEKTTLVSDAKVYMCLGLKEKNTSDKRMARVEDYTNEVTATLQNKGIDVTFEMVQGTHFSPVEPRFDTAFACIICKEDSEEI